MSNFERAIEEAKSEVLPFESWECLLGESALAYEAFCAFRDLGAERNIRKTVDIVERDEAKRTKRYRVFRNWSTTYRWQERAAGYDRYIEKLKQKELRKTIEAQGEKHREITGKMLQVVGKKLDLMNPAELTQNNVVEWASTAIKAEREAEFSTSRNSTLKQGELTFVPDFQGL